MNRMTGLSLALLVGTLLVPEVAFAQNRPSNNMWTRSAALYMDRARSNQRPEEQRALYQQALDATLEGIKNDPSNPRVFFLSGQAYVRLGDYFRADSMFTRAVDLYPDYEQEVDQERSNAWVSAYNLGVGSMQQGNFEDAVSHLQRADAIFQKRPGARLSLGSAYLRLNEPEMAIEAFRGALEILRGPAREQVPARDRAQWAENEEVAAFNMAQLLANLGKDEEAAQAYRDFLAREPNNTTAKINLAVVLSRQEKTAEAGELYAQLLADPNLGATEYFMVGVGLFRSDQFDQAREAFRKALALNPYLRDAKYNLAQSLYVRSTDLEEKRQDASGEAEEAHREELVQVYDELRKVTEDLREHDPLNRNVLLLLARAYRGIADVAEDEGTSDEWRDRALALLTEQEKIAFEVTDIEMHGQDTRVEVRGNIRNHSVEAGQTIKVVFTFLGEGGASVATQEVEVVAPAADSATPFRLEAEASGAILGWKYEAAL